MGIEVDVGPLEGLSSRSAIELARINQLDRYAGSLPGEVDTHALMLEVLTSDTDIADAQQALVDAIERHAEPPKSHSLGFQGGSATAVIRWMPALNLWHAHRGLERRHWNAFGLGDPFVKNVSIVVEINASTAGLNRRIGGAFVRDSDGSVRLVHRGSIGGGRRGIGKAAFLESYSGRLVEAEEGGETTTFIDIGDVGDPDFLDSLKSFVCTVDEIKRGLARVQPTVWWVNQGATYKEERDGAYIWAPQTTKSGATLQHHKNVLDVRKGDVVIHYSKGIRAIGVAESNGAPEARPSELPTEKWGAEGYIARVRHFELASPIAFDVLPAELRKKANGPFTSAGAVTKSYLSPLSAPLSEYLRTTMTIRWPDDSPWAQPSGRLVAVFVGSGSQSNFAFSRDKGRWGWKKDHADYARIQAGDTLLFASGYSGGSPRATLDKFLQHKLELVAVGTITSTVAEESSPFWPDEVDGVLYPYRLSFETLEFTHGVSIELLDAEYGGSVAEAVRLSATGGGRGVVVDIKNQKTIAPPEPTGTLADVVTDFASKLSDSGLDYGSRHLELARSFVVSLATKRFVLLTGLSGSGKTRIAQGFGQWLGRDCYKVIAVRPDWSGPDDLMGYENGLSPTKDGRHAWTVPAAMEFMLSALRRPDRPHLLLLDEMNLAHVERYFADVLSGMESGEAVIPDLRLDDDGEWRLPSGGNTHRPFPSNLFVVGTVNIDETTYMFSPKVLDRANTIEFRVLTEDLNVTTSPLEAVEEGTQGLIRRFALSAAETVEPGSGHDELAGYLRGLHEVLSNLNREFGHRTFFESLRFGGLLELAGNPDVLMALDLQVLQKILPRIHGSARQATDPLNRLGQWCFQGPKDYVPADGFDAAEKQEGVPALPLSFDKVRRMAKRLRENHFVSFAE
jgi:5-methylcytosine-specific restriction protein B